MLCGPYCIQFIHTQRHKQKLTLARASKLCGTTKNGTGVDGMVEALINLDYTARLKEKMSWSQLRDATRSGADVIVLWWSVLNVGAPSQPDGHWSVALRVRRNEIDLYDPDPAQSITLSRKFFEAHWYDARISPHKDYINTAVIARYRGGR